MRANIRIAAVTWALCASAVAGAEPASAPMVRQVAHVALRPAAGARGEISVRCVGRNPRYQDLLRCRLIEADGIVVAEGRAAPGAHLRVALPGGSARRLALEMNSGWNAALAEFPPGLPWALGAGPGQPLWTVGACGPLHFYVPRGASRVTLWVQASVTREAARLVVRAPDGAAIVEREEDFDERTRIDFQVTPERSGKAWSIELARPATRGWHLDDVTLELGERVPGLLCARADWAVEFGRAWRPASAAGRGTRLAARPPSRVPYVPPARDVLASAYRRVGGAGWRTSLPLTYVLDYGVAHAGDPGYAPAVRGAPPALLHLGKDVAFNHGWGPVRALGGENQAYGYGASIERLTPDEVARRIADLRAMTDALHAAGARYVTPYICGMTLNGDPERRTGFWEFYDHWDEYAGLGLARRPAADPREWLQTEADGKPRLYYRYDIERGHYPAFLDNHRFAACWRTEGWRTWLLEVVRFVAATGCDGVFVDNGCSQRSKSPAALAAFRDFLKRRHSRESARELLGIDDLDAAGFPDEGETTYAACELRRFWCETLREQMAAIRETGARAAGGEFVVFPNGGHPAELQAGLWDTDFVMFEKSTGEYGTNPGLVLQPVLDGMTLRAVNDNLFELLFVRSLRERVRPIILSRPGYPRALTHLIMNPDAARLGMAECGAFGGGGGFLLRPEFDVYHDALNDYREFFETHPDLYAGLLPWTDIALLALAEQGWMGNRAHLPAVERLTRALLSAHARLDLVPERRLGAGAWAVDARAVGAFHAGTLSGEELGALARFVENGGTLLVAGPFAERDETLRARASLPPALGGIPALADGGSLRAGRGRIARVEGEDAFAAFLARGAMRVTRADGGPTDSVRVAAYRSPDGSRIVLHLVNYLVPLGVDPPPVEEARDLSLELALPAGARIVASRGLSPERSVPAEVDVVPGADGARVRLPRLRIYAVVELRLER